MNDEPKTHSLALHLRRTIHQDAFVAVPVTDAILKRNEDGTTSIDFEAFVAQAVRIGESDGVDWQTEDSNTEAHPVQCPLPEGRRSSDAFHEDRYADQRDA